MFLHFARRDGRTPTVARLSQMVFAISTVPRKMVHLVQNSRIFLGTVLALTALAFYVVVVLWWLASSSHLYSSDLSQEHCLPDIRSSQTCSALTTSYPALRPMSFVMVEPSPTVTVTATETVTSPPVTETVTAEPTQLDEQMATDLSRLTEWAVACGAMLALLVSVLVGLRLGSKR